MILEQITDVAGKIRIIWQQPSGVVYHFKFNSEPTIQELENLANNKEVSEEHINVDFILNVEINKVLVKQLIELIKDRPTLTSNQFNTYLATLSWYDEAQIRLIVYLIGTKLAEKKDISLANMTEGQFLQKVRDYIVATPVKKLARLLLNQFDI